MISAVSLRLARAGARQSPDAPGYAARDLADHHPVVPPIGCRRVVGNVYVTAKSFCAVAIPAFRVARLSGDLASACSSFHARMMAWSERHGNEAEGAENAL